MEGYRVSIRDKSCILSVSTEGRLHLDFGNVDRGTPEGTDVPETIDANNIITCHELEQNAKSFKLHYIKKKKHMLLEARDLEIMCQDEKAKKASMNAVLTLLTEDVLKRRPKKLLVFINPDSGMNRGEKIFKDQVAPLLDLVEIETEVIVTERGKQATEMLQTFDLKSVDGVLAVGGDGTVSDVVNGLVNRVVKDNGIDLMKDDCTLPQTDVRLGVIAAGSGNGFANLTTGASDPTSSALRIIRGDEIVIDVTSVFNNDRFVKWLFLMSSYGYLADGYYWTEGWLRRLGPLRYLYGMVQCLFRNRTFDAEVEYMTKNNHNEQAVTEKASPSGSSSAEPVTEILESGPKRRNSDWQKKKGSYVCVTNFTMTSVLPKIPDDPRPDNVRHNERLYSGTSSIFFIKNHGHWATLKFMAALITKKENVWEYDNVELIDDVIRARMKFFSHSPFLQNYFMIDGEKDLLDEPYSCEIRTHQKVLRVFASGLDERLQNIL